MFVVMVAAGFHCACFRRNKLLTSTASGVTGVTFKPTSTVRDVEPQSPTTMYTNPSLSPAASARMGASARSNNDNGSSSPLRSYSSGAVQSPLPSSTATAIYLSGRGLVPPVGGEAGPALPEGWTLHGPDTEGDHWFVGPDGKSSWDHPALLPAKAGATVSV